MNFIEKRRKQKWDKHSLKFWINSAVGTKREMEYYLKEHDYKNYREAEKHFTYCLDSIETYIQKIAYLEGSVSGEKNMKDKLMKKVKKVLGE